MYSQTAKHILEDFKLAGRSENAFNCESVCVCFPVLYEYHMNELHHQGLAQQRPMEIQCECII